MNTVVVHNRNDLPASKYALEKLSAQLSRKYGYRCSVVDIRVYCSYFDSYWGPCEKPEYEAVIVSDNGQFCILGGRAEELYHEYEKLCAEYDSPTFAAVQFESLL